jgi:hypothetical protein
MQAIYADEQLQRTLAFNGLLPPQEFLRPEGLSRRLLCALTSVTPGVSECRVNQSEWFLDTASASQEDLVAGTVRWEEVDPAVVRVPALRLAETDRKVGTGSATKPQYCRYDEGFETSLMAEETVSQIFLTPPRNIESLVAANLWAQSHGLVVLPARPCTDDVQVVDGRELPDPGQATVWRISSPLSEQTVNGAVTISGTANFQPDTDGYYRVELGVPDIDEGDVRWVPVGGDRTTPVVNGKLAVLDATTLVPGDYFLRLSVYQNERAMGDPYVVSFRVGGVQAVEAPPPEEDDEERVVDVSKVVNPPEAETPVEEVAPPPEPEQDNNNGCSTTLSGC